MNSIFARASVRQFESRAVEEEKVEKLLRAAMAAPSATNQQPWEFVVITREETLQELSKCTRYATPMGRCPLGFALCYRTEGLRAPTFAQIDLSAATENLLVEAVELGLGAVWMGIAPMPEAMEAVRRVLDIPEEIQPFALVACGYPAGPVTPVDRFERERVHYEKW